MSPPKRVVETSNPLARFHRQEKDQQAENVAGISSDTEQPTAGTAKVLEAIAACQNTLMAKINEVKIDISLIRHDMSKLKDRVTETEACISRADIVHPLQHTTENIQCQLQQLSAKQDDMEMCLRRCNLRFMEQALYSRQAPSFRRSTSYLYCKVSKLQKNGIMSC